MDEPRSNRWEVTLQHQDRAGAPLGPEFVVEVSTGPDQVGPDMATEIARGKVTEPSLIDLLLADEELALIGARPV